MAANLNFSRYLQFSLRYLMNAGKKLSLLILKVFAQANLAHFWHHIVS